LFLRSLEDLRFRKVSIELVTFDSKKRALAKGDYETEPRRCHPPRRPKDDGRLNLSDHSEITAIIFKAATSLGTTLSAYAMIVFGLDSPPTVRAHSLLGIFLVVAI
jgi:hypothetical protein